MARRDHRDAEGSGLGTFASILLAGSIMLITTSVLAQEWRWPWETEARREPPRREQQQPAPRFQPRGEPAPQSGSSSGNICLDLEQRLANEVNSGRDRGANRAQLQNAVARLSQSVRQQENQLERAQCWDEFFFQRTLRNTRSCVATHRQLQNERQALADARSNLEGQTARNSQSLQDDIIQALARNRCGQAYEQQARRQQTSPNNPFASFFQDDDARYDGEKNTYRGLPFATFRTLCVRLCDGYYFPVSFSTLPNYFQRDTEACQSKCAAPAALYYHQNPGGSIEQMVSVNDQSTYKDLKTSFRYRKQLVRGCSCKNDEYVPEGVLADGAATAPRADGSEPRKFSPVR